MVAVIGKEWDFKAGGDKTSDQSNAKEFTRIDVKKSYWDIESEIMQFLNDLTTSYYADEVYSWIKQNF